MHGPHTRNLRDGTLTIVDGTTPTANELEVKIAMGDLSFTVVQNLIEVKNRGVLDHRRLGDEESVELTFGLKFSQWSYNDEGNGVSVADALQKLGGASAWASVDDACAPYAVNLEFTMDDPCNPGQAETLTFAKFAFTNLNFSEGDEYNTIRVTGRAFVTKPARAYA